MNYLFTAKICSGCVPVKALIEEKNYPVQIVSVDTQEGQALANRFNVRSLPTLVLNDTIQYVGTLPCMKALKERF